MTSLTPRMLKALRGRDRGRAGAESAGRRPRGPSRETPRPCALPGVHEAAQRLLERLPRGRLLDLGAGRGALSVWARDRGFDVTAADVARDAFLPDGIPFVPTDLNDRFPFPDASFDIVVGLEVIEHLENPFFFLREVARLLPPGGQAIISTPNEHNLQNRWAFFLTGFYGDSRRVLRPDDPELPMQHIHMVPAAQLEFVWRKAGLELVAMECNRWRRGARWLFPFVYPLQRLCYWWRLRRTCDPRDRQVTQDCYRLLSRPLLLLGRVIAYQLRKPVLPLSGAVAGHGSRI